MAASGDTANPSQSLPKKRGGKRTARACDECRLRKAKCDGLNPCEACQITDRYCTYNLSAAKSTGSGTRIRILEDRLRRARAYLTEAQRRTPSLANINFDALLGPTEAGSGQEPDPASALGERDAQEKLDSMMDSYGRMTVNNGTMDRDFYGAASGFNWIQQTSNYFDDTSSDSNEETDANDANNSAAIQLFDAPLPTLQPLRIEQAESLMLPPREKCSKLMDVVFKQVYPMFHFLYEQDFQESTDRLYNLNNEDYEEGDQLFLTLFYLVIALGYLFSKKEHDQLGCRASLAQAMRYFLAGRSMVDISHLRTIISLQSIICVIIFLVSTARMASAHAFLGAACASALRQGLHYRSTHEYSFPDAEKRIRRRVFWAIMNLDMYISAILGLPQFMDLSAMDPALDSTIEAALREVKEGTGLSAADGLSLLASSKHIELMRIVFKGQHALYPKPPEPPGAKAQTSTISVSVPKLRQVEEQFREWAASLTDILSHPDDSIETQSIKYEIHVCYYFCQVVLYRAFLHYLAKQHDGEPVDERQLSYAKTCVEMAAKVIEVSIDHQKKGLLCPAAWSNCYSVFVSTVSLIFAQATRTENSDLPDMKDNIENGIKLLACTACTTDTGSVRCLEILRRLISRVSYAVDVDLDKICAETKPCCTATFSPDGANSPFDIQALPVSARSISAVPGDPSNPPVPSGAPDPNIVSESHGWSLGPDVTMTRPSLAPVGYHTQEPYRSEQGFQQNNYYPQEAGIMQIPYGGTFSWPQSDYHSSAANLGQSQESFERERQQENGQEQRRRSNAQPHISASDIAAFMHMNPVDEPWNGSRQSNG